MHLSGVILDIYDDQDGSVLATKLAGAELPSELADSTLLEPEGLARMPDRLFALVATNGDETLRKYAMHDAAHTTTSVLYFLEKGSVLPEHAQKVAAQNLLTACGWYDLQPPEELVKKAGIIDGALGAGFGVLDAKSRLETGRDRARSTMDGFRAAQAGLSSDQQKTADLTGTEMMPMAGEIATWPHPRNTAKGSSTSPNSKKAGWVHAGDITNHRPTVKQASGTRFCLPSSAKYPIDSYGQVKEAAAYFEEHWPKFDLHDRREYAVNVAGRLDELGIAIPESVMKYAGHGYGPNIDVELAARIHNYEGTGHEEGYQVLVEKRAMTPPHVMVEMLHELDVASGAAEKYDAPLGFRDPFQAVFGKTAEEPKSWSWSEGNEYVNDTMLLDLATNRYQSLDRAFGMDVRKSFQKDPIGVFTSMPDPQKVVVARLAADDAKG